MGLDALTQLRLRPGLLLQLVLLDAGAGTMGPGRVGGAQQAPGHTQRGGLAAGGGGAAVRDGGVRPLRRGGVVTGGHSCGRSGSWPWKGTENKSVWSVSQKCGLDAEPGRAIWRMAGFLSLCSVTMSSHYGATTHPPSPPWWPPGPWLGRVRRGRGPLTCSLHDVIDGPVT